MKFSIERAVLVKAVSQAQSVVERRNTIPILANVLIEAAPEGVSFRATDLDTEVVDQAPAQVERPGATTVSAVMLNEIARKLPDGALVQISSDEATGTRTTAPTTPETATTAKHQPARVENRPSRVANSPR